jgi:hypothetical protein
MKGRKAITIQLIFCTLRQTSEMKLETVPAHAIYLPKLSLCIFGKKTIYIVIAFSHTRFDLQYR